MDRLFPPGVRRCPELSRRIPWNTLPRQSFSELVNSGLSQVIWARRRAHSSPCPIFMPRRNGCVTTCLMVSLHSTQPRRVAVAHHRQELALILRDTPAVRSTTRGLSDQTRPVVSETAAVRSAGLPHDDRSRAAALITVKVRGPGGL
jgi:hypothetical protein